MTLIIDLNADLGEEDSAEAVARDRALLGVVTSCSIACGGHAGSPRTMELMIETAKARAVAAGAHPSYPDRENFGRAVMDIEPDALRESLIEQIAALARVAERAGYPLAHVKPHGALYNRAADDIDSAMTVAEAVREAVPGCALFGPADSALEAAAGSAGLPFVAEAFVDRRYDDRARLVPRSRPGAVIAEERERLAQALRIARGEGVVSDSGRRIALRADTLCLHSDSPGALESARAVRRTLEAAGIEIARPAFG